MRDNMRYKGPKKKKKKKVVKNEEKGNPDNILKKLATQHRKSRLSLNTIEDTEHCEDVVTEEDGQKPVSYRPSVTNLINGGDADLPEWFEDLTADNEQAFKELFDMLDSAKTGLLNADTLYEGLKRVDSGISREEVDAVMSKLDKDGNGEIDFDEFLIHMTQGDMGEDAGPEGSKKQGFSRRQRLFFTAITQFSMKSTLEMERKIHQPHVISHYTAGVRLEGLTDRQLARQMRKLQKTAKEHDSPYAKPLPFVTQSSNKNDPTSTYRLATKRIEIAAGEKPKPNTLSLKPATVEDEARSAWKAQWKMFSTRGSVVGKNNEDLLSKIRTTFKKDMNVKIVSAPQKIEMKKCELEWASKQIGLCRVPLPVLKVKYIKKRPTIDDLPNIREKATHALDDYYHKLRKAVVKNAYEHWDALYADTIRPQKLLDNFRTVYQAYSPHKEEEAFVVCPWIPGPYPYFRRKVDSHARPFSAH